MKGRNGFSLLEALVAFLLLSAALLFLAMVQMTGFTARDSFAASRPRMATDLAQKAIDRFRNDPWEALRSSPDGGFVDGPGGVSPNFDLLPTHSGESVNALGTIYYLVWKISPDPDVRNLKTITVWCCWRPGRGPWRNAILATQRADAVPGGE